MEVIQGTELRASSSIGARMAIPSPSTQCGPYGTMAGMTSSRRCRATTRAKRISHLGGAIRPFSSASRRCASSSLNGFQVTAAPPESLKSQKSLAGHKLKLKLSTMNLLHAKDDLDTREMGYVEAEVRGEINARWKRACCSEDAGAAAQGQQVGRSRGIVTNESKLKNPCLSPYCCLNCC